MSGEVEGDEKGGEKFHTQYIANGFGHSTKGVDGEGVFFRVWAEFLSSRNG